jgi:hypothetical protein
MQNKILFISITEVYRTQAIEFQERSCMQHNFLRTFNNSSVRSIESNWTSIWKATELQQQSCMQHTTPRTSNSRGVCNTQYGELPFFVNCMQFPVTMKGRMRNKLITNVPNYSRGRTSNDRKAWNRNSGTFSYSSVCSMYCDVCQWHWV